MQAIITKYHVCTNTRGSRISAKCAAGSISIPYPHELNIEDGHRKAAQALIDKLGWTEGRFYAGFVTGCLPNGDYVHVFKD